MRFRSRELKILSIVIAVWGCILLRSGCTMLMYNDVEIRKVYTVRITSNETNEVQAKKIDIILKKVEVEVGKPLSTNAKDYIENIDQFSDLQQKQLSETLDTSLVNINQAGTYKYSISYKKKKYESIVKVIEKDIPNITFTLKAKIMPTTGTISRNKKDYIYEELTDDVYNNMILDLRDVEAHQSTPGKYKYTITYKDTVYVGDYEIVEDVITNRINMTCPAVATYDANKKTCVCMNDNQEYNEETKTCVDKVIETPVEPDPTPVEPDPTPTEPTE